MKHTYSAGEELVLLIGSSGRLEIALKNGNAAGALGTGKGGIIRLRYISRGSPR